MHSPQVSIIMPAWRSAATIADAIRSVTSQDLLARELLIMDGASDDGTEEQVLRVADDTVQFFSEADHGIYDAINKGISRARGEWIYVLGSDDRLASSTVLSTLMAAVPEDGADLICGIILNENSSNRLVPEVHRSSFGRQLIWRNTLHQQGIIYHRTLFADAGFDTRFAVLADYDFHLSFLKKPIRVVQTDCVIARCSANGLSKKFTPALYREEATIKKERLGGLLWILNLPWIGMKYIAKQLGGN